jgi:hypothetical protein
VPDAGRSRTFHAPDGRADRGTRADTTSEKTKLVDATAPGGFDFLGYHFEQGRRTPRKKSLRKLRDAVRENTRRANGHSLERIIEMLNVILRGWFAYFKHSVPRIFGMLDGWIRGLFAAFFEVG